MLTITVPGDEFFDEAKGEFLTRGDVVLELEHSLVSLSKWESKFEKPFLTTGDKTVEEVSGYIEMMITTPNPPPDILARFTEENLKEINAYIEAKMTATWLSDQGSGRSSEVVTSELIYYWMTALSIPFECQHWHLNRLFTLIRVCNIKQSPPKKMSPGEIARRNAELNRQRLEKLGTKG